MLNEITEAIKRTCKNALVKFIPSFLGKRTFSKRIWLIFTDTLNREFRKSILKKLYFLSLTITLYKFMALRDRRFTINDVVNHDKTRAVVAPAISTAKVKT